MIVAAASAVTATFALGRDSAPRIKTFTGLSRNHVTMVVHYAQTPPVGGDHHATWLNCGSYGSEVAPEYAVHSMEHGAVWITYRPDLPADQVAVLANAADSQPYVISSPFPGLPAPVVVSAWGLQLTAKNANDPAIAAFIKTYADGLQAPERHGPCQGGTADS